MRCVSNIAVHLGRRGKRQRIPPNGISRIEPLNLVVGSPIIAILSNRLWYNGLRIFGSGRFMGRTPILPRNYDGQTSDHAHFHTSAA